VIGHKAPDIIGVDTQASEQVSGFALLGRSASASWPLRLR
jgi:hypothetical protein